MFVAVIDSNKNKQLWSKTILSLSSISDHIKFTIAPTSLSLSVVNNAKSSHAEVTFNESYFHEYTTNFSPLMLEGFAENTYSFLLNSKHLATLFKNLDANDLDYIVFKVYWSIDSPLKYKLLIEIKTKKLIIKKYQTNYQPVTLSRVGISDIYKKELETQGPSYVEADRISSITIEQTTIKQFLDMIHNSTELFKIEVKNNKISFNGFTKQVMKDKEYLRQPMAVGITLNLDDLPSSNFTEPIVRHATFRLKDFKNFMNLISSFNIPSSSTNESEYINLGGDDSFDILFRNPGDPVVFELRNNPHAQVQFIQITSVDSTEPVQMKDLSLILKAHVVEKVAEPVRILEKENIATPRRVDRISSLIDLQTRKIGRLHTPVNTQTSKRDLDIRNAQTSTINKRDSQVEPPSSVDYEMVTYGVSKKQKVNDAETDYSDSEEEANVMDIEPYLGPTQLNHKPKSIFD